MSKIQTAKPAAKPRHRLLLGERRRLIVEHVEEHGRATVEELAKKFDTSAVTIRADLEALANASSVVLSDGGAVAVIPAMDWTWR